MLVEQDPQNDPAPVVWRPAGALTIEQAAAAWREAQELLPPRLPSLDEAAPQQMLQIDLSAVERLDTAGWQLVLQLRRSAIERGMEWTMPECSSPAAEVIRLLGGDTMVGETAAEQGSQEK